MSPSGARACIFGPAPVLTVTVESGPDSGEGFDDIHFHPGGQGFWIARMVNYLGCRAELVSPLGGEAGRVLAGLVGLWGVPLASVPIASPSAAYVHDRRDGSRRQVAVSAPAVLDRHELDDLYGLLLEKSLQCGVCVVSGRPDHGGAVPLEVYHRLGRDLATMGVRVVGDIHGPELDAVLDRGPMDVLKVSDEDLVCDGVLAEGSGLAARLDAAGVLAGRGVRVVVVSGVDEPTVAVIDGRAYTVEVPALETVDHRGSGDSMTAGLVVALINGDDDERMLRFACAAGAANATRHGLGNAKAGVVEALTDHVRVTRV